MCTFSKGIKSFLLLKCYKAAKIKKAKKLLYGNKIKNAVGNPRCLWKCLKELIFNKIDYKENVVYLCDASGKLLDSADIACKFRTILLMLLKILPIRCPS